MDLRAWLLLACAFTKLLSFLSEIQSGSMFLPIIEGARHRNQEVLKMAISQDLLEILACPVCKSKLELKADGSGLKCQACKRVYPIRDDIPVMLIDEATIEDDEPARKS